MSIDSPTRPGMTILGVIAALLIVVLLIGILLPAVCHTGHRTPRKLTNSTNLRSIHQSMFTYAQSNKIGGADGYFPGLDATGEVLPNGDATGNTGDGSDPAARLWLLLKDWSISPEMLVAPNDTKVSEWDPDAGQPFNEDHYSYAMLGLLSSEQLVAEWKQTASNSAIVLADRAIGHDATDISSVWNMPGSGEWEGSFTRNDGSTSTEIGQPVYETKYGNGSENPADHLFVDEPHADDAYLVYQDATTAFSPR